MLQFVTVAQPWRATAEAVARLLSPHAEVVLHEVATDRIVAIWNPISNRSVGDASLLGELDAIDRGDPDVYGPYQKLLPDGRRISSVSAALRDENGRTEFVLCINLDRTLIHSQRDCWRRSRPPSRNSAALFERDWVESAHQLIGSYVQRKGLPVNRLKASHRRDLIVQLDEASVFSRRHAVPVIATALGVSDRLYTRSWPRPGQAWNVVPTLPDSRIETYMSRWEFAARYHLTASDAETMTIGELMALADPVDRVDLDHLRLGYTQTFGAPALRQAIANTYDTIDPADVICFAGAEEAIYIAVNVLLDKNDHAVVVTPNYQSVETIALSICEVTGVRLHPETSWSLDVDEFERALRPNTRARLNQFSQQPDRGSSRPIHVCSRRRTLRCARDHIVERRGVSGNRN